MRHQRRQRTTPDILQMAMPASPSTKDTQVQNLDQTNGKSSVKLHAKQTRTAHHASFLADGNASVAASE